MSDRLPPLTALRAFDAAARHMSFAKAAEELNVTPAALSFQIKSLEEHLGQPVFRRLNRAIELTEAGHTLAPGVADGFATLSTAWRSTRRLNDTSALTVTAGPGITALWLAPRLYSFAAAYPDIDLRFSANLKVVDLNRDEVDIAIRYGHGEDEGLYRSALMTEFVTPMMTPALAQNVKAPADILGMPLMHDELTSRISPFATWDTWFRAHGLTPPDHIASRFNQADHAIGAAIAGAGVLMGRVFLTEGALNDGRLVAPFDLAIDTGGAYRALCKSGNETRPNIAAFLDWIEGETAKFSGLMAGRTTLSSADAQALASG